MPQCALRRAFGERHLAHQLRPGPMRHHERCATGSPTASGEVRRGSRKWALRRFRLAEPSVELPGHLLRESSADLTGEQPLTVASCRAPHAKNQRTHEVTASLAQNKAADHKLLSMDGFGLEPVGCAARTVWSAPALRDDPFETEAFGVGEK